MSRRVALVTIYVSGKRIASIIRMKKNQRGRINVKSNWLVAAKVVPSSPILVIVMM
jgi:hypothetical protein